MLDTDGQKVLLLSKYGLDAKPYNAEWEDVTWETCTLRKWLNDDFLNDAFTSAEQAGILLTDVDNGKSQGNSGWDTNGGNDTRDRLFLLSYNEAWTYFGSGGARMCAPTDYAVKRGAYTGNFYRVKGRAAGWWRLRSPGGSQHDAASVSSDGSLHYDYVNYDYVNYDGDCVRPAFWLDLGSGIF